MAGRTMTIIPTMKPTASPAVTSAPAARACTTETTRASRHQAVTSSTAAQVSAMTPMRVVWMRRSVRMRARTGKAVTDMETPRNSEKQVNGTSLVDSIG